jgi:PAS domain S-box-containing protein
MTRHRVLLVEDNPGDAELTAERLTEAPFSLFDIRQVNSLAEALAVLSVDPVDVVLLDLNLPDSQGLNSLIRIKSVAGDAPIIVLSGIVDKRLISEAMDKGAEDVFAKDDSRSRLFSRGVLYLLERNRAREQHRQIDKLLEATPDPILVVNVSGVVRYVNHAAILLFSRTREDFIGEPLGFAVRDGEPLEIPPTWHAGGRFCEVRVAPFERQGEPAFLVSIRDLTELRNSQREAVEKKDFAEARAGLLRKEISGHQQADAALCDERDRAQRYLDTAEIILLGLDLNCRITLVNRYACSMLGWTANELAGRDWIETCLPARIRNEFRVKFQDALDGDLSVVETPVLTGAGEERLIEWRNTLLRDDEGHVVGTFSSGSDITERKRAEEEARRRIQLSDLTAVVGLSLNDAVSLVSALQHCAEALVTHLGAALVRIWILDQRAGVLDLQASAGLYMDVTDADGQISLGQFDIGRIARDGIPHVTNTVIGDPRVNDQEWARREGMVAFAGHPLMVDGRVVGVMAIFVRHTLSDDVIAALASLADHIALGIARQRSARALRTAEERMRFALEAAGVGIWDLDYTTGVLRWSEILESQYGLQTGTFGGTFEAFVERVHPDDRESLLKTMGQAMKSGADFSLQHRSIGPDKAVRWLSGAGRIYLGEHGEPVRGVGISLDVTARRTLEEQYQQAQKMEAIGRLAGGVAHDFNNLLTVILGYCELLLADFNPDDRRQADIAEIQKAGVRASGLTRQLLAFSRKQIVEPTRFDLNAVVADMRSMLGRLIAEDVKVVLGHVPEPAMVKADRGQVEQIVMNLAVNARDAMRNGGTLTIETANVELDEHHAETHKSVRPGSYAVLTVTDTGTGMTPEVQARLFEPFFTTKEPGKGTGLGLATVYGIATQSGGSIGVHSEVGRGTSFKVYFPRADAVEAVVEAPRPLAQPHGGTQTVLVVEDESEVRQLAKRLLERQGYTVLIAANADEALHLFGQHASIDVLLTDVVMPGGSGPELTSQLGEQRRVPKVIYMSGYTEDAIVHHGVLNPGIAFLHKPFTSETLGRKIREVLGD